MRIAYVPGLRFFLACLGIASLGAGLLPAVRHADTDTQRSVPAVSVDVDEGADGSCPLLDDAEDGELPALLTQLPAGAALEWSQKLLLLSGTLGERRAASTSAGAGPPPAYFRSLVITDPTTLHALGHEGAAPPLHFRRVLAALTGVPDGDLDAFVCQWALTWLTPQALPSATPAPPRPLAGLSLWQAWKHDRIGLAAVVNRLDKAMVTATGGVADLGEIRLVYDLRGEDGNFQRFALIVEMVPPLLQPAAGLAANLREWALAWKALERAAAPSPGFTQALRRTLEPVLGTDTHFHIRTNEEMEAFWEFRQFEHAGGQLRPTFLPQTPDAAYADPRGGLRDWLGVVDSLRTDIVAGRYRLPPDMLASHTRHTPRQLPFLRGEQVDQARYLAAYNTCTGCHMQFAAGTARHVRRVSHGGLPVVELSRFLTRTITLLAPMPECSRTTDGPGCTRGKPREWTEYAKRIALLDCYARGDLACGRSEAGEAQLH